MATCSKCKRVVWWKKTKSGARMPIDPLPSEYGNIRLLNDVAEQIGGDVLTEWQEEGEPVYTNHFATCGKLQTAPA